jgi:hypothetical protein
MNFSKNYSILENNVSIFNKNSPILNNSGIENYFFFHKSKKKF